MQQHVHIEKRTTGEFMRERYYEISVSGVKLPLLNEEQIQAMVKLMTSAVASEPDLITGTLEDTNETPRH